MKAARGLLVPFIFGLGLFSASAAKLDFTDYAGSYKATCALNYGGSPINGSDLEITITVPRSGRQAKIKILGFGDVPSGTTVYKTALLGNLTLSSRQAVGDNALLAFYAQLPASGPLHGSIRRATFSLNGNVPGLGVYLMSYRLTFNGKKLIISGSGTTPNGPATVLYKAKKKNP